MELGLRSGVSRIHHSQQLEKSVSLPVSLVPLLIKERIVMGKSLNGCVCVYVCEVLGCVLALVCHGECERFPVGSGRKK